MVVKFHQARSATNRAKPLNHRLEGVAPLVADPTNANSTTDTNKHPISMHCM